jgi:flavin reductase (DIM6/NTAB) family NADH-FMN oxidoreductase RutF
VFELERQEAINMSKVAIGPRTRLYPVPAVLVGANVDGKPNFSTYAWCGIVASSPPSISVSFQHKRHTLKGVRQNGTFSVNIPSVDLVKETDYCGLVSGRDRDKVADCKFTVFYGKLGTAPMIEECPVSLECRVTNTLHLGSHELIVGQIEEIHATESCLTDGAPDTGKMRPFLWAMPPVNQYCTFGEPIGEAFSIGKQLQE